MSKQKYFQLDILTPQGVIYSENAIHVRAPGRNGRFGVLLHHVPSLFLLKKGIVEIQSVGGNKRFLISGGVADVTDHHIDIVAESAEMLVS